MMLALLFLALASAQGVSSELEHTATMAPAERSAYAAETVEELASLMVKADAAYDSALRKEDRSAAECVQSRRESLSALHQVAQRSAFVLQGQPSPEQAEHEFHKVAVARAKGRQLGTEVERCGRGEQNSGSILVNWEAVNASLLKPSDKAYGGAPITDDPIDGTPCVLCEGVGYAMGGPERITPTLLSDAVELALPTKRGDAVWHREGYYGCQWDVCLQVGLAQREGKIQSMEFAEVRATRFERGVVVQVHARRAGLSKLRAFGIQSALAPAAPASDGGELATNIARTLVDLGEDR